MWESCMARRLSKAFLKWEAEDWKDFDKWTGNADGRHVSSKPARAREYTATFIEQGYCFNAGESSIPDSALRGVYARNSVYQQITGSESFEPPLSRPEQITPVRRLQGQPDNSEPCGRLAV
jgi:hypothetical protein